VPNGARQKKKFSIGIAGELVSDDTWAMARVVHDGFDLVEIVLLTDGGRRQSMVSRRRGLIKDVMLGEYLRNISATDVSILKMQPTKTQTESTL